MGTFCPCEPFHQQPPVGNHLREDVILRSVIPLPFLCPLDLIAMTRGVSMSEIVEEAITEYCRSRGVDPELWD